MDLESFEILLQKAGLTKRELAKIFGKSPQAIYNWGKSQDIPYWVESWLDNYNKAKECEKQLVSIKEENLKLKQELEECKFKEVFSTIQKQLLKDKLTSIRVIELAKLLDVPLDNLKIIMKNLGIEQDKYGYITREDANRLIKFFISKKREDLRVHELASLLGIKSKTILDIAHQLNIEVKSPSSKMNIQDAKTIIDTIEKTVNTEEATSKSQQYDNIFGAHAPLTETAQLIKIIPKVWEKLSLIEKKTNELELIKKEIEELKKQKKDEKS